MIPGAGSVAELLLVEDHGLLRRVLAGTLKDAGFRVVEAASGDEALAILQQGLRPGIIVSDVRMPGSLNGLELAREARQIMPGIPVLLTTGYNELSAHEFPMIPKPYTPEELLGCINRLMG